MTTTANTNENTLNSAATNDSLSIKRSAMLRIIKELNDQYNIKNEVIMSYGRYEGSPVYVAYYDAEPPNDSVFDEHGIELRAYEVYGVEKELFNLDSDMMILRVDNEGFVHHKTMSFAEWETIADELANDMSM